MKGQDIPSGSGLQPSRAPDQHSSPWELWGPPVPREGPPWHSQRRPWDPGDRQGQGSRPGSSPSNLQPNLPGSWHPRGLLGSWPPKLRPLTLGPSGAPRAAPRASPFSPRSRGSPGSSQHQPAGQANPHRSRRHERLKSPKTAFRGALIQAHSSTRPYRTSDCGLTRPPWQLSLPGQPQTVPERGSACGRPGWFLEE